MEKEGQSNDYTGGACIPEDSTEQKGTIKGAVNLTLVERSQNWRPRRGNAMKFVRNRRSEKQSRMTKRFSGKKKKKGL